RDSAYVAASLSEKLQQHFGQDSVFYDIDNIPLGVDFRDHIEAAVGQCDVLLVIIGEEWVTAVDRTGKRRLDNPRDFVRVEIESALKRNIPIIPVLVDEAQMPPPDDLPESIQIIVYRNAAEIRAGSDFRQHIERLIHGLGMLFEAREKTNPEKTKKEVVHRPKPTAKKEKKPAGRKELKPSATTTPPETIKPPKETTGKTLTPESVISRIKGDFTDGYLFLKGAIPEGKLNNAIISYARVVKGENVLLLYDNTAFGSAKDGLLITSHAVYWRNNIFEGGGSALFSQIKTVSFSLGTFSSDINVNGHFIKVGMSNDHKQLAITLTDIILNLSQTVGGNLPGKAQTKLFVTSIDGACRLSVPNSWSKEAVNLTGKLAVKSPNSEIYVLVIPELKSDFPAPSTIDTYVGTIRDNLRKTVAEPHFSDPVSTVIGGFSARLLEVEGIVSEVKWKFLYAMVETPERFYQIVCTISAGKYSKNKALLLGVVNSFQEIS
ncbi:MAG TPA: toll/interleukin-1 receptor domain-containing protein, partial [Pyrinomonadaceae bacterium]|nr:toll/interleukin-1 receptor domain-containing protein [Pyrinomonadaceae bacterium]